MDLEVLRSKLVTGCEYISRRVIVSNENRRLAAASAVFWRNARREDLERLHGYLVNSQTPKETSMHEQAQKLVKNLETALQNPPAEAGAGWWSTFLLILRTVRDWLNDLPLPAGSPGPAFDHECLLHELTCKAMCETLDHLETLATLHKECCEHHA